MFWEVYAPFAVSTLIPFSEPCLAENANSPTIRSAVALIAVTAFACVPMKATLNSGLVGLSLTYVLQLQGLFQWAVRQRYGFCTVLLCSLSAREGIFSPSHGLFFQTNLVREHGVTLAYSLLVTNLIRREHVHLFRPR